MSEPTPQGQAPNDSQADHSAFRTPHSTLGEWWQTGIIYQIYPRSFADSNGDGIGDLPGIISKIDYLQWIGVDAVWLSPFYPSPMADFGYDISDLTGVNPIFGTLADFDRLAEELHRRGMKIIVDFVPNHTSEQHHWFLEARSSRDNPKRNWYVWADPALGGGPPNNWLSVFGGSAWEWDEKTGQYYYHAFLKEQPDLNWRNEEVCRAMLDAMRFWLDRGADGFRMDAIWFMMEDPERRDNPPNPNYRPGGDPYDQFIPYHTEDWEDIHYYIRQMRKLLDSYPEKMMVGEIYLPLPQLMTYYGQQLDECHLAYNFQLIQLPWEPQTVLKAIEDYEAALPPGSWPNWVLGNHDKHRVASRIGNAEQARVAQMLLLTLRGTPTCYYGDEIGMTDAEISPEQVQDPLEKQVPGIGLGRDPERTPMQWTAGPEAGFTTGTPWLPVPPSHAHVNVEAESGDPRSMLSLFRTLTALRRETPALQVGSYRTTDTGLPDVLGYEREYEGNRLMVVLNFSTEERVATIGGNGRGKVLLSTYMDRSGQESLNPLRLRGSEGLIVRIR